MQHKFRGFSGAGKQRCLNVKHTVHAAYPENITTAFIGIGTVVSAQLPCSWSPAHAISPRADLSSRNISQEHRHLLHPNRITKSESTRGLHRIRQSLLHTIVCSRWSAADGEPRPPSPSPTRGCSVMLVRWSGDLSRVGTFPMQRWAAFGPSTIGVRPEDLDLSGSLPGPSARGSPMPCGAPLDGPGVRQ